MTHASEFACLCDPNGLQTGIDLGLKLGEMIIYNTVDGKPVVLARKVDGGDWKLEGVYAACVTETEATFNQTDGHRSLVRCVFETSGYFDMLKMPIVKVALVGRTSETVELGIANFRNGYDPSIGSICYALESDIPDGKWKITATRVG